MKILTLFLLIFATITQPEYKVGDKIQNFSLLNATDNKQLKLSDLSSNKLVVLCFTNHSCPYSKVYDGRMIAMAKEFETAGVKFVFINSQNTEKQDQLQAMADWGKNNGLIFLKDDKKVVAQQFGATKTPEVFVLKSINSNYILEYKGAIDDNPQAHNGVSVNYLKDAIQAGLKGEQIKISEKRATGCMIK